MPARSTDTNWRQFLHAQAATKLAADFFHVGRAVTRRRLFACSLSMSDLAHRLLRRTAGLGPEPRPDGCPDRPHTSGETRVDGGTKMIASDAAMHASQATHNLAVAGIAAALAGKPALLGYIPGREAAWDRFVLQNGGQYLFVSGNGRLRSR